MLVTDTEAHTPLTTTFSLPRSPDLAQTVAHARMGVGDPCLRVVNGTIWRASRTPEGAATEHLATLADGRVRVTTWGPGAAWLLAHAAELCGAADSPEAFAPEAPLLQVLARANPGLRIGRTASVFETAMLVTLEQRVATREAWQNWRVMIRALGEPAPGPFEGLFVPPSPERVARTPYEIFHRFGVERRRAEVIRRLAAVAHRLEDVASVPIDTAYRRLRSIPGVGPWTAARTALIALGDPDAVPIGDLHIPHLVTWRLAGERRGSDERMLELLAPYQGHRARVIRLLMTGAHTPIRAL